MYSQTFLVCKTEPQILWGIKILIKFPFDTKITLWAAQVLEGHMQKLDTSWLQIYSGNSHEMLVSVSPMG